MKVVQMRRPSRPVNELELRRSMTHQTQFESALFKGLKRTFLCGSMILGNAEFWAYCFKRPNDCDVAMNLCHVLD